MRFTSAILIVAIVCKSNARELNSVLQGDKEYNEVNSEATGDSFNCTPSLRFPENTIERNITWELMSSTDKCSYEYRINLTEVSDINTNTISEKVNTTFYHTNDIKPCTRYNVSVDVFEKGKPAILATVTDIFNSTITLHQIKNLNLTATTNTLSLSWEPSAYVHSCNIYYYITSITALPSRDVPYFRQEHSTQHWIHNLRSCTQYTVSIVPSSIFQRDHDDGTNPNSVYSISTLPDKVTNLHLELNSNHTEISWRPPQNHDCIKEYKVIIGNDLKITKTPNIAIDKNSYCSEVRIEAVTDDNQPGEAVTVKKPGPVQNLKAAEINSTSLAVTWDKPIDASCVADYVIQLGDFRNNITNLTEYTFWELKPCETYAIKVAARTTNGTVGDLQNDSITMPAPQVLGPVTHYNKQEVEDFVNVSWYRPENAGSCSITYILKVSDDNGTEMFNENTTSTSYSITTHSYIGCTDYNISIIPSVNLFEGTPVKIPLRLTKVTHPPSCKDKYVNKTDALLECEMDNYTSNKCNIKELSVRCKANRQENRGSWVIWKANANVFIYDDESRHAEINIQNLSEFTNYTCTAFVKNEAGMSLESKPIMFRTKAEVPNRPTISNITGITSTSFNITWDPPMDIRGILEEYRITIQSQGPQYILPSNCSEQGEPMYNEPVAANMTEYFFDEGFAKYKYAVYVEACTIDECSSPSETKETETIAAIPDKPPDIHSNVAEEVDEDYNVTVEVFWTRPCYTNGRANKFEVEIWGKPTVDENVENYNNSTIVPVNDKRLNYSHSFSKLPPAFCYVITVKVVTEDDLSSVPANDSFISPDGVPDVPGDLKTLNITSGTFTAEWSKPSRQNGIIKNYIVEVSNLGPLYYVPKDCIKYHHTDTDSVLPPEETNFEFKEGLPSYKYKTSVMASTITGIGAKSEIETITLEAEPEGVLNFGYEIINQCTEEYGVSMNVYFEHPCKTNGILKYISVNLDGKRLNYEHHTVSHNFTTPNDSYDFTIDLLAEYTYTVNVQVENQNYQSEIYEEVFISPSGVPPNVENITAPVPNSQDQAVYSLSYDLFDCKNGKILYYSVIIGMQNHEEESKYGCWDSGDDKSWPIVGSDLNEEWIQPYEATPRYWNPFNDSNSTNYTIVLGDTTLGPSNTPLKLDVVYTFKIRAFTSHGYRDSPTITFWLPVPEEVAQLGLILGLIFGVLVTAIVLAVVFILWRRRQQWAMKKESIKSIPLTPMPISIKQFPEYYSELKENSDRLKHEYLLLGNQSCEVTLPAYDGMLPENKKKNRYTNVIPYDQTRVKLADTNDNYSFSDYINASYIQGYSGTIEYIATQGPLEHTCVDFWKMIIQENVSLIVMVAQFVEQTKEKCFKYFPDNHENMELENGIAIRCSTELSFKSYSVRTFLVQKDLKQWTVTHLQFTEWPDFGCPTGTEVMLEFCQLMREYAERNTDPVVIHCSAGVGRTGTLIALDIILQIIKNKEDIDVFGTVLNLRRDRRNMVQTEKQYLYIHNCINDAVENPSSLNNGDIAKDPIYENLDYIKKDVDIKENVDVDIKEDVDVDNIKEDVDVDIKENADVDVKESQF